MIAPPLRDTIKTVGWDSQSDPWGSVMQNLFGLCSALYLFGADIPEQWQYRHGAVTREDVMAEDEDSEFSTDREFLDLLESETVTESEMIHAGWVLMRARDILETMGRDY